MTAPLCPTEDARLDALYRYNILDTPREEVFDSVTRLLASVCKTPMSMISFVDKHRQWFKSEVGLGTREMPREVAFCAYTILQTDIYVVADATKDPLFLNNELVLYKPNLRFYAAAPIITYDNHALGTVGLLDTVPRVLTSEQKDLLVFMARQVMAHLELRRTLELRKQADELNRKILESTQDSMKLLDLSGNILLLNESGERLHGLKDKSYLHKNWDELWPAGERARVRGAVAEARTGKVVRFQGPCRTAARGDIWKDVIITPIRGAGGEVEKLLAVSRDITASKKLEEWLAQSKQAAEVATQAKDNFIAVLSHELRSPLAPVLLATSYIQKRQALGAEEQRALDIIRHNIELESRLIEDLLDLTRIIKGKINLEKKSGRSLCAAEPRDGELRA